MGLRIWRLGVGKPASAIRALLYPEFCNSQYALLGVVYFMLPSKAVPYATLKSSTYATLKSSTYAAVKSSTYATLKSSTYATLKSSTYPLSSFWPDRFFF